MPALKTHTIMSPDRCQELRAEEVGQDIRITLSSGAVEAALTWDFSRMFPLSTRKPWDLVARKWTSVSLAGDGKSLRLTGVGDRFETSVEWSFRGRLLEVRAEWTCVSTQSIENASVALALDLHHDPATERITLPHILYNGNPSADPKFLVPLFGRKRGDCLVCEETRFPIPCVNVEWLLNGAPLFISLFAMPDPADVDWSLGCARLGEPLQALCASGLMALNGKKDQCYGAQRESAPLEGGYRSFKKGDRLRKTCFIEFGRAEQVGWGFRSIVRTGYEIHRPEAKAILPPDRVIELKANALRNRWHEDAASCGFTCTLPASVYKCEPYYLYGWTGQSLMLAWCAARLGMEKRDQNLMDMGRRAADFYVKGSRTSTPGLRYNYYVLKGARWTGENDDTLSSRATGETLWWLGRLIRFFEKTSQPAPAEWTEALRQSAEFLLRPSSRIGEGLFPMFWREDGRPSSDFLSAAGIPCVLGILEAYKVTREPRFLDAAKSILALYWHYSGDRFDRPFARSTLDARCEDKEAGIYFFLSAYELFLRTGDPRYRTWAEVAADWILTYVYLWHTGFLPGSYCAERGFITTGWPGVSVQNHHLDVFFPACELHDFGRRIGNKRYEQIGRMVFDAWSHGICRAPGDWEHDVPGEQGEQFYHTNWGRARPSTPLIAWRGGYNPWNPSWIIGLVLSAALRFRYDGPNLP